MTDKVRYPKTVVIDGVEYKIGDKVPIPKSKRKTLRPFKAQFVTPLRRS